MRWTEEGRGDDHVFGRARVAHPRRVSGAHLIPQVIPQVIPSAPRHAPSTRPSPSALPSAGPRVAASARGLLHRARAGHSPHSARASPTATCSRSVSRSVHAPRVLCTRPAFCAPTSHSVHTHRAPPSPTLPPPSQSGRPPPARRGEVCFPPTLFRTSHPVPPCPAPGGASMSRPCAPACSRSPSPPSRDALVQGSPRGGHVQPSFALRLVPTPGRVASCRI